MRSRAATDLARLRIRAGSSEPSLLAFEARVTYAMEYRSLEISTKNSMTGSNYSTVLSQHQNA